MAEQEPTPKIFVDYINGINDTPLEKFESGQTSVENENPYDEYGEEEIDFEDLEGPFNAKQTISDFIQDLKEYEDDIKEYFPSYLIDFSNVIIKLNNLVADIPIDKEINKYDREMIFESIEDIFNLDSKEYNYYDSLKLNQDALNAVEWLIENLY